MSSPKFVKTMVIQIVRDYPEILCNCSSDCEECKDHSFHSTQIPCNNPNDSLSHSSGSRESFYSCEENPSWENTSAIIRKYLKRMWSLWSVFFIIIIGTAFYFIVWNNNMKSSGTEITTIKTTTKSYIETTTKRWNKTTTKNWNPV